MADRLINIYLRLKASYREKRLKKQKALTQIMLLSGSIKRVK